MGLWWRARWNTEQQFRERNNGHRGKEGGKPKKLRTKERKTRGERRMKAALPPHGTHKEAESNHEGFKKKNHNGFKASLPRREREAWMTAIYFLAS